MTESEQHAQSLIQLIRDVQERMIRRADDYRDAQKIGESTTIYRDVGTLDAVADGIDWIQRGYYP